MANSHTLVSLIDAPKVLNYKSNQNIFVLVERMFDSVIPVKLRIDNRVGFSIHAVAQLVIL